MNDVCVIANDGQRLMPTNRVKARKLLKAKKAVIVSYRPFAIKLTYEIENPQVQEIELCVDTGPVHMGFSVKSKKHEYVHLQADNLKDEKERHVARASYRRDRRNRLRYRKPRFNNRRIPKGWLAPSIQHKKDNHIRLLAKLVKYMPITRIVVEVGQFDPALMRAKEKGISLAGADYQHGPAFGLANIREAVFVRDGYKCRLCGKGPMDGIGICIHHNHHRSKGGSNSVDNLATICEKHHILANHKPGMPLADGALGKMPPLKDATFMNIVRKIIVEEIETFFPDIPVSVTYGSYTKTARRNLGQLKKTHANDAYAMGEFHPKHRHAEVVIAKCRRNNRVLSKFYDAKYVDIRDGKTKKGSALSCSRTNRRQPRNNVNNMRIYRGRKVSCGHKSIRRKRYSIQPDTMVMYKNVRYTAKSTHCNGTRVLLDNKKSVPVKDVTVIKQKGGWRLLPAQA